ncbi:MAG: hypothetical protein HOE48_21075, partial [Candidatus Latescibacteria bacterium]|nr:hypothetical protein [Candidatus Latescibacterota bacterium]
MPVFVSRFSSNRVARANLQQIRSRSTQANTRVETTRTQREQRQTTQRTQGSDNTRQTARAGETLLARTQIGQQIAARLQEAFATRVSNRSNESQTTTQTQSTTTQTTPAEQQTNLVNASQNNRNTSASDQNTSRTNNRPTPEPRLQTPPGVGATRTRADNNIDRPGRLNRSSSNSIREQQLSGFARLRAVASGLFQQTNNTRNQQPANTNGQINRTEARTRFLASNGPQPQGRAVGQQPVEPQETVSEPTPLEASTEVSLQVPTRSQAPTVTQSVETPTAEEISRANTTDEIRENLQQDAGEIAR